MLTKLSYLCYSNTFPELLELDRSTIPVDLHLPFIFSLLADADNNVK